MAIYAVGDLQGCLDPLRHLLDQVRFDPVCDRLWLVGDLVNRGPQSLETLRFVRSLGPAAITVLGNHDLSLLALAQGHLKVRRKDTFQEVLAAPDADELLHWLRQRPLLHHDPQRKVLMVHAGLAPQWTLEQACAYAAELEATLRGPNWREFIAVMFGHEPDRWHDALEGAARLRCITNILTRIRYCTSDGRLDFDSKGPPGTQPAGLYPWFSLPHARPQDTLVVFGHWAALGLYRDQGVMGLDSGCVWGHVLSMLRLDVSGAEVLQAPGPRP